MVADQEVADREVVVVDREVVVVDREVVADREVKGCRWCDTNEEYITGCGDD
jgi:hypothetical protein